jgi:hypothetical protein
LRGSIGQTRFFYSNVDLVRDLDGLRWCRRFATASNGGEPVLLGVQDIADDYGVTRLTGRCVFVVRCGGADREEFATNFSVKPVSVRALKSTRNVSGKCTHFDPKMPMTAKLHCGVEKRDQNLASGNQGEK